jgi:hypothetical protein
MLIIRYLQLSKPCNKSGDRDVVYLLIIDQDDLK